MLVDIRPCYNQAFLSKITILSSTQGVLWISLGFELETVTLYPPLGVFSPDSMAHNDNNNNNNFIN